MAGATLTQVFNCLATPATSRALVCAMESFRTVDANGRRIAIRHQPGRSPAIIFLAGYASDMTGAKAEAIAAWAARRGQASLRFDYSGCGLSDGELDAGTISVWTQDALAAIDAAVPGAAMLVGSSMGGWIALLVALARPTQVKAIIGIAPAPDFTQWGIIDTLTPDERAQLAQPGHFERASDYGPTRFTRALVEDGAQHLLMNTPIDYGGPVRLLHGQRDPDVPWQRSLALAERIASDDVQVTLVKDGDHRLSRPCDLALLTATLEALLSRCSAD